jgi:UDP-N-acetylglucosamine 1-carboxyvinyltransferase
MHAIIEGGVPPTGSVRVSGAKNSATRLLAAALLADDVVELSNFPTKLVDVQHKIGFCRSIGALISVDDVSETVNVNASSVMSKILPREGFDIPIRTTYLLAAGQVIRSGIARVPYPGGCPIGGGSGGGRGYDLHILVWECLGAVVTERADHIEIAAPDGFIGSVIDFPITTVGGTENALLCSAVATGRTEIFNAYITPEIEDLIALLRRMGATIEVFGTSHIVVEGRAGKLSGARMSVMTDRIEALTWIVYAIISKGSLTVDGVPFDAMTVPLLHLEHAGIDLYRNSTSVHINPGCLRSGHVQPFELACGTHPGVISDMQAFFVMLGLVAAGKSRVHDYRYPDRIGFVSELAKLVKGDNLSAERGKISVNGPVEFVSGVANSTDLRGSMAVVMAALCADGQSVIRDVQMALRGYNDLEGKLRRLGARISVLEGSPAVDLLS